MRIPKLRILLFVLLLFVCVFLLPAAFVAAASVPEDYSEEWESLNVTEERAFTKLSEFHSSIRCFDVMDDGAPLLLIGMGDDRIVIAEEDGTLRKVFHFDNAGVDYRLKWQDENIVLEMRRSYISWEISQEGAFISARRMETNDMTEKERFVKSLGEGKEYRLSRVFIYSLGGTRLTVRDAGGSEIVLYDSSFFQGAVIISVILLGVLFCGVCVWFLILPAVRRDTKSKASDQGINQGTVL